MYDFSYKSYSKLLEEFLATGYRTTDYIQFDNKNTGRLLLRHDIDITVFNCERISDIEAEKGFRSTWFFQPDNAFYNPLSPRSLRVLTKLSKYHSLGLHIEPSFAQSAEGLTQFLNILYDFFSNFLPLEKVFSFHRPSKYLRELNIEIPGFVNAYSDIFTKEMVYISDSNRRCFWEQERIWNAMEKRSSINLLIHPIWWGEKSLNPEEILPRLELAGKRMARNVLSNNVSCFAEIIRGKTSTTEINDTSGNS